ncbi:MAG: hypothetical protein ACNI25_12400 [Halarcobacter sp.]
MKTFLIENWNKFLLLFLSLFALIVSNFFSFDHSAKALVDDSFTQAVIVFGSAKALNAVISLAQGTQLDLPFIIIAIGEVLDPINDLVEQFSLVMLACITSLGIQKILLNFVTNEVYNYLLLFFVIVFNIWLFKRFKKDEKLRGIFFKVTFILLFLRLSIPLIAYINNLSYNYFVKPEYNIEVLNNNIVKVKDDVSKVTKETINQKSNNSFINKVIEKFDSSYYEKKVEEYRNAVDNSSDYIIDLIIVFIFQTILLPLVFLFFLYSFIKSLFILKKS